MIISPGITVNGVKITPEQINTEVQYHPAENLFNAKYDAMQALVVREILLQRAISLGLCNQNEGAEDPDNTLDALFQKEIEISDISEQACLAYYQGNKKRFLTSPLFEAAHILYLASPKDEEARKKALAQAEKALVRIKQNSDVFETIAQTESACSSSKMKGHLGQVTKGQTTPEFEKVLFDMVEGEISFTPLASSFGYHLIKVYKRLEGKQLPFEAVQGRILDHLFEQAWQCAFSDYVGALAKDAHISGFRLKKGKF